MEVSYTQDLHNPTSLIHTQGLNIKIESKDIVKDGELIINRGTKYGLIGKNGTGKSTLLRCILNQDIKSETKPFATHQTLIHNNNKVIDEIISSNQEYLEFLKEERIIQEKIDKFETEDNENNDTAGNSSESDGMELYDRQEELQKMKIEKGFHKVEYKAKKILTGLGFDIEAQDRIVNTFSGGWRMRISLAKVLFIEPTFLLLDEPTNHLDFGATIWLGNYLREYPHTLILVSHNIDFLNNIIDSVIELDEGKIGLYKGNYEKFKKHKNWEFEQKVKLFNKNKKKMNAKDRKKERPHEYQVKLKLDIQTNQKKHEIKMEKVYFSYGADNNERIIFEDLYFNCKEGEKVVIVGDNGSGKSTFIKMLMGKLQPQKGEIQVDQRIRFGYLSQNYGDLLDMDETPVSMIQKKYPHMSMTDLRKTLSLANLNPQLHHHTISTLSGGEQTRVIFSLISLLQPNFMILDEPTNNLDIYTIETLSELIDTLECGVILVSHDTYLINSLSDYSLYICEDNNLLEYDGNIDDYVDELMPEAE